jgi:hypothetical protein
MDLRCLGVGTKEFFFLFLWHKVHSRVIFRSLENNFEEEHKVTSICFFFCFLHVLFHNLLFYLSINMRNEIVVEVL